jgi:hypothetical protein
MIWLDLLSSELLRFLRMVKYRERMVTICRFLSLFDARRRQLLD